MHNNAEVLAALSDWLSPGEVSQLLNCVLRVPEAWQQLQRPGFLARLRSGRPRSPITPAQLGKLALGESGPSKQTSASLTGGLEERLESLWQQASQDPPARGDLETVMLLAFGLVRQAQGPGGAARLVSLVLSAPLRWRSALACAWNQLPAPTETLSRLAKSEKPEAIALAANSLQANSSLREAASAWLTAQPDVPGEVLIQLQTAGERPLAEALAASRRDVGRPSNGPQHKLDPKSLLNQASRLLAEQDLQGTRELLQQAWDSACSITAQVADHLADLARFDDDLVLELEARQHAIRSQTSPRRRASLVLTLLDIKRPQDALNAIPKNPTTSEEHIAAGLTKLELWQPSDALEHLQLARQSAEDLALRDGRWVARLASAFKASGHMEDAVDMARLHAEGAPCSVQARLFLAEIQSATGDHAAAAQEAHIALALAPQSVAARECLARSLQAAGTPEAAIPHWQTLTQTQPEAVIHLAECALAAGQIALTKEAASQALQAGIRPAKSRVLYAKALSAAGEQQAARHELEQATQSNPNNPEAWIALAHCQMESGNTEAVGATLASAVQAAPNQAALHVALAKWLRDQGRLTEALQAAEQATSLEPEESEWLIVYGELLHVLGHQDRAQAALRTALARLPTSWPARLILAEILEAKGEITDAWHLVSQLPNDRSAQAHFLGGRLAIQAAALGDEEALPKGFSFLETAQQQGVDDADHLYWLARGHEIANQPQKALDTYQACLQKMDAKSRDAYLPAVMGLANAALALQQGALAISTLEDAQAQFPNEVSLLTSLSRTYLAAGQTEKALVSARQAAELDPSGGETLRQLGRAAASRQEWEAAIQALERLASNAPEKGSDWLEMAQAAQEAGKVDLARSALARALALGRRQPKVLQQASSILLDLKEIPAAQRLLKRALYLEPQDPGLLRNLGTLSERVQDDETAQAAWSRLAELEPDNDFAHAQAAQALWALHRRAEAIGQWEQALEIEAGNAELHIQLARALLSNAEHQRALDHFADALTLLPENAELHFEAGLAFMNYASFERALETLRRATQLDPGSIRASEALAECLLGLNQAQEAREILLSTCQSQGAGPKPYALLALASARTGDLKAAKAAFESAYTKQASASTKDARSITQAALVLGHWNKALEVLANRLASQEDAQALVDLAHTHLRISDAHWLFAEVGEAIAHAPSIASDPVSGIRSLPDIMAQVEKGGLPADQVAVLQLRMTAASGEADQETLQKLETYAAADATGMLSEGIAIAHLRSNRPQEAQRVLAPQSNGNADGAWTYLLLGLSLAAQSNLPMARKILWRSSKDAVLNPLASYLTARCHLDEGQVDEAISQLNQALAAWPDEPRWQFQLAQLYQKQGDTDAALPHLQQACDASPDQSSYRLELARALHDLGQLSEAEAAYAKIVKAMPSEATVWKEAGKLALAMGNHVKASQRYERACALAPSDAHCLVGLARAAAGAGDLRQARRKALDAHRLAPEDAEILLTLAEIQARDGKLDQALETYQRALMVAADPAPVILARGRLLSKTNQHADAIKELRLLIEEESENDHAWFALAEAHQAAGDHQSAAEAATVAVRFAPRNGAYRAFLGRACHKSGQLDRALDELTQAEAILPTSPEIPLELGRIFEIRRDTTRALEAYERALALDPECSEAHFRAGVLLKERKAYAQAGHLLKRAVELNPKNPDLLHQLAAVRALELVHGGMANPAELS
jgi:tetratricopeptide (TPR) repeat protein